MTPNQRMARAHEIFAQVWGQDETDDRLYDVADETRAELCGIADDFETVSQALSDSLKSLRAMLPETDEGEEMGDELDLMGDRVDDIEAWLKPMRELADRLNEALLDHDAEARVA